MISFKRNCGKNLLHTAYPKKINKQDIGKCKVKFPVSIVERQKIADCLSSLDEVVEKPESNISCVGRTEKRSVTAGIVCTIARCMYAETEERRRIHQYLHAAFIGQAVERYSEETMIPKTAILEKAVQEYLERNNVEMDDKNTQ